MAGLILRLHRRDERALLYVVCRRRPWLDRAVRALTHLGGATATIGVAALSVGLGLAALLPGIAGMAAVATGLLVGVTRCYLGVHYPGDVVAGWLLALTAFAVAGAVFQPRRPLPQRNPHQSASVLRSVRG
ncbi:MAG TPA: phosphatase PAP2 family protein [Longimicrobiales bacterium]|nr:phosphatase PAP2 family protein [Longimicrobiales bacterium]